MYQRQELDPPYVHESAREVMKRLEENSKEFTVGWYPPRDGEQINVIAFGNLRVSTAGIYPLPSEELIFQYCRTSERFRYVKLVEVRQNEIYVGIQGPDAVGYRTG